MEKIRKALGGEQFSLKSFLMEKIIYLVLLVLIVVVICIEPRFLSIINFSSFYLENAKQIEEPAFLLLHWQQAWCL